MSQIGHSLDNVYEALFYRLMCQIDKWKFSWGWDNDIKSNVISFSGTEQNLTSSDGTFRMFHFSLLFYY